MAREVFQIIGGKEGASRDLLVIQQQVGEEGGGSASKDLSISRNHLEDRRVIVSSP